MMLTRTLTRQVILAAFTLFCATAALPTAARAEAKLINGAGATFPFPIYTKWFSEFQKKQSQYVINYQSIGSGGGIRQLIDGTVDFGASDSPMTDEMLKTSKKGSILHIPTVMGAVVLTYNLPDLKQPLNLSAEVVSEIYLGKIQKWNDPKIVAMNSKQTLPDVAILPVYRSDGSGTTGVFTDYLTKTSPDWKKVGQGNSVKFPEGVGGKGNEGVTGVVKQTKGAIGYVELIYAKSNSLSFANIKNQAGEFVEPTVDSVTAAADACAKSIPQDLRVSITNATGKKSYPISAFTYLLVYKDMPKDVGAGIHNFINWALSSEGQAMAKPLFYAPLPKEVATRALVISKTIELK